MPHEVRGRTLVEVARRLTSCTGGRNTLARLGGDEFVVRMADVASLDAVVGQASMLREALSTSIALGGRGLHVRASIGVAVADSGTEPEEVIRDADLAMHEAKGRRDGEIAIFDPAMRESMVERLELENALRTAVKEQSVVVHYQPTVTVNDGDLVAVEALLRWTDTVNGEVPPSVFIPLAEQCGLIQELGLFVLEEACSQGKRWMVHAPDRPLNIGVNVSGKQLQRGTFAAEVAAVLSRTGFPAERLVLEMTESVLMADTESSVTTLWQLKELGVKIAIDDFGGS